jgi:squalene-associated FAD-dependent desaturase
LSESKIARGNLDVGIVGGGYAGMASAVALAERGIGVTVYEAARRLGGRARAIALEQAILDNGQHLLIGAYHETLRLVEAIGVPTSRLLRLPLQWSVGRQFSFRTANLPAPWHLLIGLIRSTGISISSRVACIRFLAHCRRENFALRHDMTVTQMLYKHRQNASLVRLLWEPLCVAALNTPIEQASARVFLTVLRDSLGADKHATDLILPRCDLSAMFPEPAAEYVRIRGGRVHLGETVLRIDTDSSAFSLSTSSGRARHCAVVLASHPSRVAHLARHLPGMDGSIRQITALTYEPIVTIYLCYDKSPHLPFPMTGLTDGHTQWVFDRQAIAAQPGLIAAVISARGRHQALSNDALAQQVHEEIAAAFPPLAPPLWTRVIEEKRATFAAVPNLERPDQRTPIPGLFLAGDYTRGDYPATLEAAVRSGLRCAELASEHVALRAEEELTQVPHA